MHIVAINGAPPAHSEVVSALLGEALKAAAHEAHALGDSVHLNTIVLSDLDMPFHDGSLRYIPRGLETAFDMMREADAFIFGTTVNWFDSTDRIRCFINWLTALEHRYELQGKVGGVIVHLNDDGGNQTAMSIIAPLLHMGVGFPPYAPFYRNNFVAEHSEERWQMTDQVLVGQNVVRMAWSMKQNQRGWSLTT